MPSWVSGRAAFYWIDEVVFIVSGFSAHMMMYSRDKNKIREQRRDAEKRKHGIFVREEREREIENSEEREREREE